MIQFIVQSGLRYKDHAFESKTAFHVLLLGREENAGQPEQGNTVIDLLTLSLISVKNNTIFIKLFRVSFYSKFRFFFLSSFVKLF
jgi:hypothetical protein